VYSISLLQLQKLFLDINATSAIMQGIAE